MSLQLQIDHHHHLLGQFTTNIKYLIYDQKANAVLFSSLNSHPIASLALEHRNYSLAAGVNLFVVLLGTVLWMLVKSPLELSHQRLLTAGSLSILWCVSNEIGTYKIMPRSSTTLDQLDQWTALASAILLILFSWTKELKNLVMGFNNKI